MSVDAGLYARAVARMSKTILWLGAAGMVLALIGWGWRAAIGFALGAGAAWTMFGWLKRFVEAATGRPTRAGVLLLTAARYGVLGAGLYVIFIFSKISLMGALVGLFLPTAAAIAEGVFELLHGERALDHQDLQ